MPELTQIRNVNLKVIFLVHFIFTSVASMGFWSSTSYLFYNAILIFLLIWSIYQEQSHEPIQLAIVVNGTSIILDILLLVMGFPTSFFARERFSSAMAILHLFVRPVSTILLIKNLEERSGSSGVLTGILSGHSETYEDIDRMNQGGATMPQSSSNTGYGFATAQQI
nr:unnamed protein product [Callosobruchus analis]